VLVAAPQAPAVLLRDALGRPLRSLRLSVTDRCNLRCSYCMPEPEYVWLPKKELLTFEELDRITGIFCTLGVDKVRLTGESRFSARRSPPWCGRSPDAPPCVTSR
jgi:cyclic pyranopterin phosphate synthase